MFLIDFDATEHLFVDAVQRKEILIYCGTTMLDPVMKLAGLIHRSLEVTSEIGLGSVFTIRLPFATVTA